jgi:hypothetical protein
MDNFVVALIIYGVIHDILNHDPFVRTNEKPPNKYWNIIRYKQMICTSCGKYIEKLYKRTIPGFVDLSDPYFCGDCTSQSAIAHTEPLIKKLKTFINQMMT